MVAIHTQNIYLP